MATIDLADKLGANIAPSTHSTRFPVNFVDVVVDLAEAATAKGSALAAADIIEAIDIPAGSVVLAAGIEVVTAQVGATVLTMDLGVTGVDVDGFVDGFDYFAATVGAYAAQPAAHAPIVVGTADTIDLLIATQTGTNTAGKVRVWAVYGTVNATRNPGLAALKS